MKKYASYAFSIKRQMPCIIGGENGYNFIHVYEEGGGRRGGWR